MSEKCSKKPRQKYQEAQARNGRTLYSLCSACISLFQTRQPISHLEICSDRVLPPIEGAVGNEELTVLVEGVSNNWVDSDQLALVHDEDKTIICGLGRLGGVRVGWVLLACGEVGLGVSMSS